MLNPFICKTHTVVDRKCVSPHTLVHLYARFIETLLIVSIFFLLECGKYTVEDTFLGINPCDCPASWAPFNSVTIHFSHRPFSPPDPSRSLVYQEKVCSPPVFKFHTWEWYSQIYKWKFTTWNTSSFKEIWCWRNYQLMRKNISKLTWPTDNILTVFWACDNIVL